MTRTRKDLLVPSVELPRTEGVVQFHVEHESAPLAQREAELARELCAWRSIMRDVGAVGAVPHRYDGLGFGNVSRRVGARSLPRGRRAFLVSGTQTGNRHTLTSEDLCIVRTWDLPRNAVESTGPVLPSSESLTHAIIYDQSPAIVCVLHGHSPEIWNLRRELAICSTPENVAYGTVEMARAFEQLFRRGRIWERRIAAMEGHEDGIVAFGRTVAEAGLAFLDALALARARL